MKVEASKFLIKASSVVILYFYSRAEENELLTDQFKHSSL